MTVKQATCNCYELIRFCYDFVTDYFIKHNLEATLRVRRLKTLKFDTNDETTTVLNS